MDGCGEILIKGGMLNRSMEVIRADNINQLEEALNEKLKDQYTYQYTILPRRSVLDTAKSIPMRKYFTNR